MMLRPRPARWFEVLTARDDATLVLEALARTGAVELQARAGAGDAFELQRLMPLLARFGEWAARYQAYWPAAQDCRPSAFPEPPTQTLQRCLDTIAAWAQEAEPLIRTLQKLQAQIDELRLWQRVLAALPPGPLALDAMARAGPLVEVRLLVLPAGVDPDKALWPALPGTPLLASPLLVEGRPHLLVAAAPPDLRALAQRVAKLEGNAHAVPEWLHADAEANTAELQTRLRSLALARDQAQSNLALLDPEHGLSRALGDANRLQWLQHNVHALEEGELFCWITGWTSDPEGTVLAQALHACPARALLQLPPPPEGMLAPLLLHNPPWARPFELFSRALGMPSANEADPSPLLAVAVPLMFGYMFGDVGQGLVIAAVGWSLRKRFAVARLLMVGGLSAVVFGFVFGSVFSLHGLLPAWWLHPLDAPLAVLFVPLVGGVVLLTLGLGLDALAMYWRGAGRRWLLADGWLLVVYLSLLAALKVPAAVLLAAAAALAWCLGHALAERRITAALTAIGELLEKTVQLLINTLSFARVGAFALAHAGLSSAIVALMAAADSLWAQALVLVLGNALVIVLEAMVVSIQTTRLVLFEFFTRFMQGQGRVFRPLPAPPFTYQEN